MSLTAKIVWNSHKSFRNFTVRNFSLSRLFSFEKKNLSSGSGKWRPVVGLEVHAQLDTNSKLFSQAQKVFGSPSNYEVSLFDAAIPGTLPVLNKKCVELGVLAALALSCKVNPVSYFDRKHYFYPDLPAGYQITQQRVPLAENGNLDFFVFNNTVHKKPYHKCSKITKIQLEQDSGKSLHLVANNQTYVDLNRAGIGLIEIVFEPDLKDGWEAANLVKELCIILNRTGVCSTNMEEGALRVDANVSVHEKGEEFGVRTEIKNLGSIHAIVKSINYESERQIKVLRKGGTVINETMTWNGESTIPMRDKEEKQDYRFMPEPCLPSLRLIVDENSYNYHKNLNRMDSVLDLQYLREKVPELPQQTRERIMKDYQLTELDCLDLLNDQKLTDYFVFVMTEKPTRKSRTTLSVLFIHLRETINSLEMETDNCPITGDAIGQLVDMLDGKIINRIVSKKIIRCLLQGETMSPEELVEKNGWWIITDVTEIQKLCDEAVVRHSDILKGYKKKRKEVPKVLVDEILLLSNDRADTKTALHVVTKYLESLEKKSQ